MDGLTNFVVMKNYIHRIKVVDHVGHFSIIDLISSIAEVVQVYIIYQIETCGVYPVVHQEAIVVHLEEVDLLERQAIDAEVLVNEDQIDKIKVMEKEMYNLYQEV